MAERPLLAMPRPETRPPETGPRRGPRETVHAPGRDRQEARLGPKFSRLEQVLSRPEVMAEAQDDPAAIVPERALVFEVASEIADFYRALRAVRGFEFLGEEEILAEPDEDFFNEDRPDRGVTRRLYFTIGDQAALEQLLSLWRRHQRGEALVRGWTAWRDVFNHLHDLRRWGPQDRLTDDVVRDWEERLEFEPDTPIPFEIELWYYGDEARRNQGEILLTQTVEGAGGQVRHRSVIDPIRYHGLLAEVPPPVIRDVLANPAVASLLTIDQVMVIRPQSMVAGPLAASPEDASPLRDEEPRGVEDRPPLAALLDGVPIVHHDRLSGRLQIDDPDDLAARYGSAAEQRHGTAMASLILHGDLNAPDPMPPIRSPLHVRPILYAQPVGVGEPLELMPPDQLGVDVIWRAFLRMYEGEGDTEPTAPEVRVVNLSVGDAKRRFAGPMSPWGRLLDYLAWRYRILILISAGNIGDPISLDGVGTWSDIENAEPATRRETILRAVLQQRAYRSLLSPAEAMNALTIGAAHSDHIAPNGHGPLAIDPYDSRTLPNVSSALGLGYRGTVKPDILFPGGAEHIRATSTKAPISALPVHQPARFFGIGVAALGPAGEPNRQLNISGTSAATALATHASLRILEELEQLPTDPVHPAIDPQHLSLVLKALLLHSARWDPDVADVLKAVVNGDDALHWTRERDELTRVLGFGIANMERVLDCAASRATLLGWGALRAKHSDRYQVPLPPELDGVTGFRSLSVTVAWLTPTNHLHRLYRLAKFSAAPGSDEAFSLGLSNAKHQPTHHAVGRGTAHHQRWEGEKAAAFVDDGKLVLDIRCSPVTEEFDDPVPYAAVASLEVGADVAVEVYERIRERLREAVRVAT